MYLGQHLMFNSARRDWEGFLSMVILRFELESAAMDIENCMWTNKSWSWPLNNYSDLGFLATCTLVVFFFFGENEKEGIVRNVLQERILRRLYIYIMRIYWVHAISWVMFTYHIMPRKLHNIVFQLKSLMHLRLVGNLCLSTNLNSSTCGIGINHLFIYFIFLIK